MGTSDDAEEAVVEPWLSLEACNLIDGQASLRPGDLNYGTNLFVEGILM
jgi:hypothetical protein